MLANLLLAVLFATPLSATSYSFDCTDFEGRFEFSDEQLVDKKNGLEYVMKEPSGPLVAGWKLNYVGKYDQYLSVKVEMSLLHHPIELELIGGDSCKNGQGSHTPEYSKTQYGFVGIVSFPNAGFLAGTERIEVTCIQEQWIPGNCAYD